GDVAPSPLPACGERSDRIARCDPGEGVQVYQLAPEFAERSPSPQPSPRKSGEREKKDLYRRGRDAAVDDDGLAGHEGRSVGGEIGRGAGDLVRFADPPQRRGRAAML